MFLKVINKVESQFSISIQLKNTKINIEEVLKDENPDTRDYIYRIKSEFIQDRTSFCFIRYKCPTYPTFPPTFIRSIFGDELKRFQIYKKVCFVGSLYPKCPQGALLE